MNDFDDDPLRAEFDRRAGRGVSVATAHDAVLARSGRIRRRRAAVAGSGALVALVVGGSILLPGADGDSRAPSDSGQPIPSVDDRPISTVPTESTRSTVPPSTTSPAVVTVTADTVVPRTAPTATVAPTTTATTGIAPTITTAATSGATSPDPGARADSPSQSSTSSTSSSTVAEPSVAPFSRTYESPGGSISVDWNGDSFTLLTVAAAPGFEAEIEDQRATRIRVRFRGDDDARIELRIEDGQLIVDIS